MPKKIVEEGEASVAGGLTLGPLIAGSFAALRSDEQGHSPDLVSGPPAERRSDYPRSWENSLLEQSFGNLAATILWDKPANR